MKLIVVLVLIASEVLGTELNPLSDEFINYINNKQNTWTAGRNFDENTPIQEIRKLLGAKEDKASLKNANKFVHSNDINIPDSFDSRQQWPECKNVISQIADQSACGSCWAVSVASAMSDRRCIHSQGKYQNHVSAEDILSCCSYCAGGMGCGGGAPYAAWNYWHESGIVTGGLYNSSEGCKPYPFVSCEHHINGTKQPCSQLDFDAPECTHTCKDPNLNYKDELTFGKNVPDWILGVENIQREVLTNGPVSATFNVFDDFLSYKSGVYQHTAGNKSSGHAVRLIGWGVEKDIPYWLLVNSWNEDWGDNGYFKIIRGKDEVGIESGIYAALPKF